MMTESHIGSSFDSFLEVDGIRREIEALAQKRVIAWQIKQGTQGTGTSKAERPSR
jgi:hypothetical protein